MKNQNVKFEEALETAERRHQNLLRYIYENESNIDLKKIKKLTEESKLAFIKEITDDHNEYLLNNNLKEDEESAEELEEEIESQLSEFYNYSEKKILKMFSTFCKIIKLYVDDKISLRDLELIYENCYDNIEDSKYYEKYFKKSEEALIERLKEISKIDEDQMNEMIARSAEIKRMKESEEIER